MDVDAQSSLLTDVGNEDNLAQLRGMHSIGWHRKRVRVSAAIVMATFILACWGCWNPGNLLYVARLFNHPVLGGLVMACALLVIVVWAVPTETPCVTSSFAHRHRLTRARRDS